MNSDLNTIKEITCPNFQFDMKKNGWQLIGEDAQDYVLHSQDLNDYDLVPLLNSDEKSISDQEMLKRAKKMKNNLGQLHAEYFLKNQNLIPEKWKKLCLIFPGTTWRTKEGIICVPYIDWNNEFRLNFNFMQLGFSDNDQFVSIN